MITKVNPYGHISLTNDYFSGLVAQAARQCYGIAAMGETPPANKVRQTLRNGSLPEKGVTVSQQDGQQTSLVCREGTAYLVTPAGSMETTASSGILPRGASA